MDWLNYHHLLYFWCVAKHGTVTKACEELRLAQPTISGQIHLLESTLGEKLFIRTGRRLVLTEMGQLVFKYAEDIFATGQELMNTVRGEGKDQPTKLVVGIAHAVPKPLATQLLKSALKQHQPTLLVCQEDTMRQLLLDLTAHRLDLVIADTPVPPSVKEQIYNHPLGESGVTIFGTAKLAKQYRHDFPRSLQQAPLLLPGAHAGFRRLLDQWMVNHGISPNIVGEFDDSATLKTFGQDGYGLFPGSSVIEKEICRQYRVQALGELEALKQNFYAITVERRLRHPAALAIVRTARQELLS